MKRYVTIVLLGLSMGILGMLSGCAATGDGRIQVLSTTGMIHDLVVNIAGDKVQATALMGPGIDPHLYKASQGDIALMSKADLIFYNGLHLEAKLGDVFEKMDKSKPCIPVTRQIPEERLNSPDEFAGYHDPHVWFDVSLWIYAAKEVAQGLAQLDSANKDLYFKNAQTYIKTLEELDQWVKASIESIPPDRRYLVTAHDAFGYFGRAYGMTVRGIQGISTVSEAGTKDIQELSDWIIQKQIPSIFVESSVPIRNIQALQHAVIAKGVELQIGESLFTDAMGDAGTKEGTYVGMIQHNVNSIVEGLK